MALNVKIIRKTGKAGKGLVRIKKSAVNKITRDSWEAVGEQWHKDFKNLHFKPLAVNRYGYQPRTRKYRDRKKKYKRHDNPLMYTGDTFRASRTYRVAPRKHAVDVIYPGVRTLNRRPHMRAEFEAITKGEITLMERTAHKLIMRGLKGTNYGIEGIE